MSDIRIYISTHKANVRIPDNKLLYPVQVGTAKRDTRFEGMFHDDEGENISLKNGSYCELTGQYWVWKNQDADYYGFFHYRRYLSFADTRFETVHEPFIFDEVVFPDNTDKYLKEINFNEEAMTRIIEENDFIAPASSMSLSGETVYEQYQHAAGHHIEDLDSVISIIRRRYPEHVNALETYMRSRKMYCCNMFVMKKELFHEYCAWLFSILEEFEDRRDLTLYPPVDGRVTGYLAERLCGVYITYLYEKGYKGCELQKVFFRETDPEAAAPVEEANGIKAMLKSPGVLVKKTGSAAKSFAYRGARKVYKEVKKKVKGLPPYSRHREDIPAPGKINIVPVRAIPDMDGRIILQFKVQELIKERSSKGCGEYKVELKGDEDKNALFTGLISMRDKCEKCQGYPAYILRTGDFSAKLSAVPSVLKITASRGSENSAGYKCTEIEMSANDIKALVKGYLNAVKTVSQFEEYNDWYLKEHRVKAHELALQSRCKFDIEPVFSIIVPLYKTPVKFFREMADSVTSQSYRNFELILVNASPNDRELSRAVKEYTGKDSRIKEVRLPANLGITENTNAGIEAASGDFISFLDHDDLLERDALFEYVKIINRHPDTDLLYCDEDKICDGIYTDPYFKPDYNHDLLMGINYVCHFLTVRKSLVDEIEKPTSIYDGAQDYNMTFRIAEKARYIAHASRILYHWRIHENSTASDPEQKSYTLEAARLCIQHHLERTGIKAQAVNSLRVPRHYELVYDLGTDRPRVSIVIPNKNSCKILKRCIDSLTLRTTYDNYEIVIVDNGSTDDDIVEYYKELMASPVKISGISYEGEFNFAAMINAGVAASLGDYLVFLNNDTEIITNDWIERLLGPCMRSDIGAAAPKLLYPDGTVQHAGIVINQNGPMHLNRLLPRFAPGYYDTARLSMDVSAVTAACMMTSRSAFEKVGGFNEELKVDYNDVDYCLKLIKAGYNVLYEAGAQMYHYESATRSGMDADALKTENYIKGQGYLMSSYSSYYTEGDPNYNKNFAVNGMYYSLV